MFIDNERNEKQNILNLSALKDNERLSSPEEDDYFDSVNPNLKPITTTI